MLYKLNKSVAWSAKSLPNYLVRTTDGGVSLTVDRGVMKATTTRVYASPQEKAAKSTGSQSKDVRLCAVCATLR